MHLSLLHRLAGLLNTCPAIKRRLQQAALPVLREAMNHGIPEITPLRCRATKETATRVNILLPSINQEHLFGGISTALSFFDHLTSRPGVRKRIITTDTMPNAEALKTFTGWTPVPWSEESGAEQEIIAFGDRYGKTIPLGANDLFVATAWWTAFHAQEIMRWQQTTYSNPANSIIYLIQDFEPGFYAWSSKYALAESTYRSDIPTIAIFNSSLLHDFFTNNGYRFNHEFIFEPVINRSLQLSLSTGTLCRKKKQILVYGRPSVERNAFPLIVEALKSWVWQQPDVHEWRILSAGETHRDLELGNGICLQALGKLTLEAYASVLRESAIGISLMISPHPSYPPMEMAMFGMSVITNVFRNKDLSSWHENIHSVQPSVNALTEALLQLCFGFPQRTPGNCSGKLLKPDYLRREMQFSFIDQVAELIRLT